MNNKREPLSNATPNAAAAVGNGPSPVYRSRPAVSPAFNNGRYQGAWDEPEQPFDFLLELSEVERAPAPMASAPAAGEISAGEGQSNVITKPPPPLVYSSPRQERPEAHGYGEDLDWDEVTPRSSVAVALLSSPDQVEAPPVSSEANPVAHGPSSINPSSINPSSINPTSNVPSTEPTGGRHQTPKRDQASAPVQAQQLTGSATPAFPMPGLVPFPLTEPVVLAVPGQVNPAAPAHAPVRVVAAPRADGNPATLEVGRVEAPSAHPAARSNLESLAPVTRSDSPPHVDRVPTFAPSFTLDNAPITTRGTYRREMEARVREPKKPWLKWAPAVLAAFALPFIGASLITSWIASRNQPSALGPASGVEQRAVAAQAVSPVPPHTDGAARTAPQPGVAAGEQPNPTEVIVLPESLGAAREASDEPPSGDRATTATAVKPNAGNQRSRPALDKVDFSKTDLRGGLTSASKAGEPSYRVKIPDEQNAPELRDGAHNVPVRE